MKLEEKHFNLPDSGWRCADVFDVRADGSATADTEYERCELCRKEKLRFVHVMTHDDFEGTLNVGCVCAQKLTGDLVGPKKRQEEVARRTSERASQKKKWINKGWTLSERGNPYRWHNGHHIVVRPSATELDKWVIAIDLEEEPEIYPTEEAAKLALFDRFWPTS